MKLFFYHLNFKKIIPWFQLFSLSIVEADAKDMGGQLSHEYHYLAPIGEQSLQTCSSCGETSVDSTENVNTLVCSRCNSKEVQRNRGIEVNFVIFKQFLCFLKQIIISLNYSIDTIKFKLCCSISGGPRFPLRWYLYQKTESVFPGSRHRCWCSNANGLLWNRNNTLNWSIYWKAINSVTHSMAISYSTILGVYCTAWKTEQSI